MFVAQFRYLAALIAAHPHGTVVGRTRLQNTVRLLQRVGFPSQYAYTMFFYGPFSEGLQLELHLLQSLGMAREYEQQHQDGTPYYIVQATGEAPMPNIEGVLSAINQLGTTDAVIIELAAAYDTFRELGCEHDEACRRLRRKKGVKCKGGNERKALGLLEELGLSRSVLSD